MKANYSATADFVGLWNKANLIVRFLGCRVHTTNPFATFELPDIIATQKKLLQILWSTYSTDNF
jgi:hypothetical protein